MRLVIISDTHNQHEKLQLPEGDLLLHAGDFSGRGTADECAFFLRWFAEQPHRHKVFIAGNHDYFAENSPRTFRSMVPGNVVYLQDSGIEIEGLKIWGSPVQPWFFDWAFNRQRGADIRRHWDLIPADTDILLVHGPPHGILDRVKRDNQPVGCQDLLEKIEQTTAKVIAFGHIHEGYGILEIGGRTFVNASVLDENYRMKNDPVVMDFPSKK